MAFLCYAAVLGINLVWLQMGNRLPVNYQLLFPLVCVVIAGMGVLLRTRSMGRAGRMTYRRKALWMLLFYYLAILSVLLFFGGLFHVDRVWGGAVNLEPFYTIRRFLFHYRKTGSLASLWNLLGNVIILVPLGILLPVIVRPLRRCWLTLPLIALFAVGVEFLQWRTGVGVADVDDSILNFVGGAMGYVITRLCQMVYFHFKGAKV